MIAKHSALLSHPVAIVVLNGAAGAISGGASKLIVYPLDTLKKRLQLVIVRCSFEYKNECPVAIQQFRPSGWWMTAADLIRHEGVRGFYKVMGMFMFMHMMMYCTLYFIL